MIVYFRTNKLKKLCSDDAKMRRELSPKLVKKLQRRLAELNAVDSLADMSHLPPSRCHELKNRSGVFSVDLEFPMRLLFVPTTDPLPLTQDGGIDRKKVTQIEIFEIEDTHDAKSQRRGAK